MTAFLQQLAHALLKEHGGGLREVAVVLPSQRAALYLRQWLAREAGKAQWSPQAFTIGSFMEELAGMRPLANEELVLEGYVAYRVAMGDKARPLEDFLQWGTTALADISEADAHLVDHTSYYRNLRAWEELDMSFMDDPLSEGQQRMVRFWAMVGKLHTALNERLKQRGAGTTGLIERTAVERMNDHKEQWKAIWFAGLNALTPAQQAVLHYFKEEGLARFAWEADRFFLDNPEQEAGAYLRKHIKEFGEGVVPIAKQQPRADLRVDVVRAPNGVAQAWVAASLLRELTPEERSDTAVVLADESLLQPLLEALPGDIGQLNITMGLAASKLPVGSFIAALHKLYADSDPQRGFFHVDLERFLGHPFVQGNRVGNSLLAEVRAKKRAYLGATDLQEAVRKLAASATKEEWAALKHAERVFVDPEAWGDSPAGALNGITTEALAWAHQSVQGDPLASEQVYQASLALQRVSPLLTHHQQHLAVGSYALLFRKLLAASRIGFTGEPLGAVQIMGMLEARTLDPGRVILLGAQEGVLPASSAGRSFIPFQLRRHHKMPMPQDKEAVQAYNFFRLLQRCKQATIVWSEDEEAKGPSRFVLQLKHEWGKGEEQAVTIPMVTAPAGRIEVKKDGGVLKQVEEHLAYGLSPSALATWLTCPLDYYFRYVLRLKETEELEARIPPNVLGTALHEALERIYAGLAGAPLQAEDLERAAAKADQFLDAEWRKQRFSTEQLARGEPLLQRHMALSALKRFLHSEARRVREGSVIELKAQEEAWRVELPGNPPAGGHPPAMRGRLDRVDHADGLLRILDYKTGTARETQVQIGELSLEALRHRDKRYGAQLLVYAWLYLKTHPEVTQVKAGLLPLQRRDSSEPIFLTIGSHSQKRDAITREDLDPITNVLQQVVNELLDPAQGFVHNPDSMYCKFCLNATDGAHQGP